MGPGDEIAGWVIERQLGSGGMGEVFLARHPRLPRSDALKVLNPELLRDEGFRRRFFRETEVVCELAHPHVVSVYDRGEYEGRLYFAMQYVAGGDLRQKMAAGRLSLHDSLAICEQIASALDAAHEKGLVHRDVKPENVLLHPNSGHESFAILADFGISRAGVRETAITSTGQVLATPGYAAPEVVVGDPIDGRTDQYALGCMLFELVAGTVPFERDTPMASFFAHVHEPVPALSSVTQAPKGLDAVIRRAMAKKPADRYPTCRDFIAAAKQAADETPATGSRPSRITRRAAEPAGGVGEPTRVSQRPQGKRRRRGAWIAAGALALVAALVLSLVLTGGSSKKRPPAVAAPKASALIAQPSIKRGGTLKALPGPDCQTWDPAASAFSQGCLEIQRLYLRQLVTYAPGPGPSRLMPDLAREVAASADQRTWRYELKPGLRWEDGRPITSFDVKYGIERNFASELGTSGLFVKNMLVGSDSYAGPYRDKKGLDSIETPDASTVIFHLTSPFPDWNYVMAEPYASPVPQARDTVKDYGKHPVASGPYKFASYKPNNSLTFARNPQWNRASDPARAALPDSIEMRFIVSNNDQVRMIEANQADVQVGGEGLAATDQLKIENDPALRKRLHTISSNNTAFVSISTAVPPLDNVHCRRAVAWAVDRQALLQTGELGPGALATRMLPPGLRAGGRSVDVDLASSPDGAVARARQELAACGRPNGFHVNLAYFGIYPTFLANLSNTLSNVGITVTPKLTVAYQTPALVRSQQLGIALSNWAGDWDSPYAFFAPLVDAKLISATNNWNTAEIRDRVIQDDLAAATSASTETARRLAWSQLDEDVLKGAYYLPLSYGRPVLITSPRLTNVYASAFFGDLDLTAMGVIP